MTLTGLQIFKYLPGGKKEKEANCKKCGFPTCMAFAMKLAKNEADLSKCEYMSDELKALLQEASQPQQIEISFGSGENAVKVGNETVMFRHDKKFVNPTCLTIKLKSCDPDFDAKLARIANYSVDRVGEILKVNAIALLDSDDSFIGKAKKVCEYGLSLVLISSNAETIRKTLAEIKDHKPLVYLESDNIDEISAIGKEFNVPVVITADNIEYLAQLSGKALQNGLNDIVLNIKSENLIENLTFIRRSAIEDKFRPMGFPVITFIDDIAVDDPLEKTIRASALICKYSNILVLDYFDEALVYALLTLRQNIFTDPQKPLQIDAKVYLLGDPDQESHVFVTTNFALTYFSVVSEIEASGTSAYLLITPSDGMSVLTAWAADKFTGEVIAKAIRDFNLEGMVKNRKIIVPGYVSHLKEEIEEEAPGWEVISGPNDAVDIPEFIKSLNLMSKL
jgi:acetyl-CoA decarbonylase/synthase, CODH/ACS complex subunit gamma